MFGVQSVTAFLFAFAVLGLTAALFGGIAVRLVRGITAKDANTTGGFGAITVGLLLGLLFHWSAIASTYMSVLRSAINVGNTIGAYEAYYLPILFIVVGVVLLTLGSGFSLGSAARNRRL